MKSSSPTGLVILRRIIKKSVPPSKKGGKKRGGRVKKKKGLTGREEAHCRSRGDPLKNVFVN